jgi:hypothetical protein
VRDQVRDQVREFVYWWYWTPGQFDSTYWLSYLEALRDWCDFDRVAGLIAVAESCAWAWTFPDIVVFCAPPTRIARDADNRLHHDSGAAVMFADGWGVYAIHGVRVPQQVVESPETLTPKQIRDERNAEVRRVMIERFGQERFVRESGAVLLDTVDDDAVEVASGTDGLPVPFGLRGAKLYRVDLPDDEPIVMVALKNSTPEPDGRIKDYMLRVPPGVQTVREAVSWTFDLPAARYAPLVES